MVSMTTVWGRTTEVSRTLVGLWDMEMNIWNHWNVIENSRHWWRFRSVTDLSVLQEELLICYVLWLPLRAASENVLSLRAEQLLELPSWLKCWKIKGLISWTVFTPKLIYWSPKPQYLKMWYYLKMHCLQCN